jgi:hypothetical protein
MKKELIIELFEKFEAACFLIEETGVLECAGVANHTWLCQVGHTFSKPLKRPKMLVKGQVKRILDHFADVGKLVEATRQRHSTPY